MQDSGLRLSAAHSIITSAVDNSFWSSCRRAADRWKMIRLNIRTETYWSPSAYLVLRPKCIINVEVSKVTIEIHFPERMYVLQQFRWKMLRELAYGLIVLVSLEKFKWQPWMERKLHTCVSTSYLNFKIKRFVLKSWWWSINTQNGNGKAEMNN